ncbi:MAG: hypothetical protein KJZ75_01015 [Hyphomonadaceae bacterium]|nr:hypothetical protein [Hyphomonadaceae bacterium]
MRIIALIALAALSCAGIALAQTQDAPADPVAACQAAHAEDQSAHIACLENAITALRAAPPAPPPAAVTEAPRRFVFSPPQPAEATPAVTVRIVQVSYNREGLGRFVTEEGQAWRETTPAPQRRWLDPDEDYTAQISRGMLGGYRMNVEGIRWEYKVEPLN